MKFRRRFTGLIAGSTLLAVAILAGNPVHATTSPSVQNRGFEDSLSGWTISSGANEVELSDNARTGTSALKVTWTEDATVTVSQLLWGVPEGAYTASAWTKTAGIESGAFALGDDVWRKTGLPQIDVWKPLTVRSVPSTSGQVEVLFTLKGTAGQTVYIDDVALQADEQADDFFIGGDINFLTEIEDKGGEHFDEFGEPVDPIEYMASRGMNIARLRVYNDPGADHPNIADPQYNLVEGYQNPADILDLAKHASDAGMEIQLTFHYSDYWTNGETQDLPYAWHYVNDLPRDEAADELERPVSEFTTDFLTQMKAQGSTPKFVALGNETMGGILYPYGGSWQDNGTQAEAMARFFTAGYEAVKEVAPDSQVILHLPKPEDRGLNTWWFGLIESLGNPYDVIGASYYPFWTQMDVEILMPFFEEKYEEFGKPFMVMETGYKWNPVTPEGTAGQLHDNGPVLYGETPAGQLDFLRELFAALRSAPDGMVLGNLYWDPMIIPAEGVGWAEGFENVVSNTTLWDFDGVALPAFLAYEENASALATTSSLCCQRSSQLHA